MEKYIIMKKVNKFKLLAAGLLIGVAFWLLGSDFFTFMIWWEILWILGLVFMPITAQIFKGFDDNGWMNSKVIAIVICGYGVWILTSIKVVHFTTLSSVVITTLCGGEQYCLWNIWKTKKGFSVETYGTCLLGRSDFLCCISFVDIYGRISSGSSWN
jgi:hypothetical protein